MTQDLTKFMILLNGELKTLQIASISKLGDSAFRILFKNNPKTYTYSAEKVVWLTDPQWLVPELCKVFRGGCLQKDRGFIKSACPTGQALFYDSKIHTAWQAIPSPDPVNPRPSSVVAFTFTCPGSISRSAAMFFTI